MCKFPSGLATALAVLAGSPWMTAGEPRLTVEALFHPDLKAGFEVPAPPRFQWLEGSGSLLRQGPGPKLVLIDPEDGSEQVLSDAGSLRERFAGLPDFDSERAGQATAQAELLVAPNGRRVAVAWSGDLFWFDAGTLGITRLTEGTSRDELPRFSPDGRRLAFIRDHDLYVSDLDDGNTVRLTEDGGPTRLNGKADWLYWEEVFRRGGYGTYWWSPRSDRIAFLQLDISQVPVHQMTDGAVPYPGLESQSFPKAGMPNPLVRVGLLDLEPRRLRWLDLNSTAEEILVVRLAWSPDGQRLFCQVQDRGQTRLDLWEVSPETGVASRVLREETPAWVDPVEGPLVLPDGSLLWTSSRTGFQHLYRLTGQGEAVPLTSGEWEVTGPSGVHAEAGWVYFTGNRESPLEEHLYRVPAGGGEIRRLTAEAGTHEVRLRSDGRYSLDTWSSLDSPPRVVLRDRDGRLIRRLHEPEVPALARLNQTSPVFTRFPVRDGFELEGLLVKPPGFDPARRYPVLLHVYGGPRSPIVRNRWPGMNGLWHRLLAEQGIVVCVVDPRPAAGRGAVSAWPSFRRLGVLELRDLEDVAGQLRKLIWVDGSRLGIWGSSYGGYVAAYVATRSPLFRFGIAVAPVTDWRFYDTIYTERYMGKPDENPDGYREASVVEAAPELTGRLLLIHGTADDNVHPQHTMELVKALQRYGKSFDLMLYPGARHGIRDPWQIYHYRRLKTEFVLREFGLDGAS